MPSDSMFGLHLVDAVTEGKLREHVDDDGMTWVKGDAGEEFFVQISCETFQTIKCEVSVDGKGIGYTWLTHKPDISIPLGPIKANQDTEPSSTNGMVTHAFRFVELDVPSDQTGGAAGDDDDENIRPGYGTIVAKWFTTRHVSSELLFVAKTWEGTEAPASTRSDNKKDASVMRSTVGCMPGSLPPVVPGVYEKHEEIGRLEIRYTSDFGMAVRGLYKTLQPVQWAQPKKRTRDYANLTCKEDLDEEEVVEVKKEKKQDVKVEYNVVVDNKGNEVIELD